MRLCDRHRIRIHLMTLASASVNNQRAAGYCLAERAPLRWRCDGDGGNALKMNSRPAETVRKTPEASQGGSTRRIVSSNFTS